MNERKVEAKAIVRAPPARVFAAFVEPAQMRQFWFDRRDDGMSAGARVQWFIGREADAYGIDVAIVELIPDRFMHVRWGEQDSPTDVKWWFAETDTGDTRLTIEESGISGTPDAVIDRLLDSTGGFNQVIIAAKAFVEHGIAVNVVTDRA